MSAPTRCAMWTPLPPERSGIADYSYELLSALIELVDVTAVARDPSAVQAPAGVPIVGPAVSDPDVLNVYQMGNHAGVHSWIYSRMVSEPGIVVLHDTALLDFHFELHGGMQTSGFIREAVYAHGRIRGNPSDPALINGWPAIEVDGVRTLDRSALSMERRVVSTSRGVIVHDPASAAWLSSRYPDTPVFAVPSGAPLRGDEIRDATRATLDWRPDDVVFGIFGGFGRIKRVLVAVLAFAQLRRSWPQARLLIAGHTDDREVLAEVHQTIAQLGVESSVHIELSPPKSLFEDLISAADAVVNLRWPTAGETSAVMMRAYGAGKPVITSDLPQHRHFDPSFCLRVSTDPAEEARTLLGHLTRIARAPEQARAAGAAARDYVRRNASWPVVAAGYRDAIDAVLRGTATAGDCARVALRRTPGRPGVNVLADLRATTGISEAARRHSLALLDAGVDLTFTEFNSRAPYRSVPVPERISELRRGKDHPVDLWMLNLNEFHLVPDDALDRYTIALWAWEMPEIVDETIAQLKRLDELWVVSSFVADAFRTVTEAPITVIPNVVPDLSGAEPDRARFNLPADGPLVLFSFSASSSDGRKNPWGVIDAFRRAFTPAERGRRAHLVIKAVDLADHPEMAAHLAEAVAGVNGTLIGEDLSRVDMNSLLATCDVYISLHRSEGFGLGMAEAMSLGKPVVATAYGGNTDFMPPGAAALIGYSMREVHDRDHRFGAQFSQWYRPGQIWAEPNVDQAARWLRRLADDQRLRQRMGRRAATAISETCSAEAVGAAMARRLAQIELSEA